MEEAETLVEEDTDSQDSNVPDRPRPPSRELLNKNHNAGRESLSHFIVVVLMFALCSGNCNLNKFQIFNERCETSQLRKQVASLQMGLDTANDMLDSKKVELGRAESLCCVLRTNISHIQKQLDNEQQTHEDCKQEIERLKTCLEDSKAKDPLLADQIKVSVVIALILVFISQHLRRVMTEFGPKNNIFILSIKIYFCPICIKNSNNLSILPVLEGLADIWTIVCMSFKVPVLRIVHILFRFTAF